MIKNIQIKFVDLIDININEHISDNIIGAVIQTVDKFGYYNKNYNEISELKQEMKTRDIDLSIILSCDLLHHTVLKSPKELGS